MWLLTATGCGAAATAASMNELTSSGLAVKLGGGGGGGGGGDEGQWCCPLLKSDYKIIRNICPPQPAIPPGHLGGPALRPVLRRGPLAPPGRGIGGGRVLRHPRGHRGATAPAPSSSSVHRCRSVCRPAPLPKVQPRASGGACRRRNEALGVCFFRRRSRAPDEKSQRGYVVREGSGAGVRGR